MPSIAEQRARIAELASRMIAKNPGNAGAIMQQLKGAGLDISGNPLPPGPFQMPNVPPAGGLSYTGVMTGDQLGPLAKYAGRTPAPPGGLTADEMAIPFNGTGGDPNSLRAMADRGDPGQAPDFRSRIYDASKLQRSARVPPGSGLATAGANPTAQVQGQLPGNFMSPGNLPRPRPFEGPIAARPEGPLGGLPAAAGPPPPLNMARPEGPPGGFPAATPFGGNMPMPRQTAALGSGERSPMPGLPRARPPEMGPPMPSMAQSTMPGSETMGPPSPLASRFGDQSQLASGAFSGGRPPMPQSTMPGSETFAPPSALASQMGGQPPMPGGAFSGPPPPMAAGPTPRQLEAARDQVRQIAALRPPSSQQPVPPTSPLMPLETTPTSTMPNPLQRAPLNLAAGVGAPKLPLGSTSLPFAGMPRASVDERTADVLGPLPPGAGTGVPVRSVQQPLIGVPPASGTVPPVGPVPGQDLPAPPGAPSVPPVGVPSMLASVGPPAPARMEVVANYNPETGQRTAGTPRARGKGQAHLTAPAPEKPVWTAPKIGMGAGTIVGAKVAGPVGAVLGGAAGWGLGRIVKAMRARGQDVDAQGNILDKAGNIIGHVSDMAGSVGRGMSGIFGRGGSSSVSGGNWGSNSGYGGGFGGGGGYGGGGTYGGSGGYGIREGVGGAFRNR